MLCKECIHFNYIGINEQNNFTEEYGECRKNSPNMRTGVSLGLTVINRLFPITYITDWCGDFKEINKQIKE